jgi:opacity protein-like surface antigen
MRQGITLAAALWAFAASAGDARADWLLNPFIGTTFGAETAFITPDPDAPGAQHWTFGGSGAWLSDNVLGIEADLAFAPGFFEAENAGNLVTSSGVTTLFGNVVLALPLSVTRDSLRPYVLGGLGLVHVNFEDWVGLVDIESSSSVGLQIGGGALGLITNRTGVRFDLRHVRSLARTTDELTLERRSQLSFWRASVGVVVRY